MFDVKRIPAEENSYIPSRRVVREDKIWQLKKRYGLLLIGAFALAAWTIFTCCITGTIAHHNAWQEAKEWYDQAYEDAVEEYKSQRALADQAAYWKSGDASLEAQINTEADLLSRVDIWTTDEAFLTFVCNVWVRTLRADYPGSVVEVLQQPGQYDFFNENKPIDEHRRDIARELLWKLHKNVFPTDLTVNFAWLEMQKDGARCVLHSKDTYYVNGDETWRYRA